MRIGQDWLTGGRSGEIVRTFCVVTVGPNEVMAPIHDRMPVILTPDDWSAWLAPDSDESGIAPMVSPAPAESMEARRVSRRVSNAREDGVDLVEKLID